MEVQKWAILARDAAGTALSNAPTATGVDVSRGAPAGAVTETAVCNAQSAAALASTPSAGLGDLVDAARAYLALYDSWWSSLMRGPYNGNRDAAHWELVHERQVAWQRYADLLQAHGLQPPDRRGFARGLAMGGVRE